MITAVAKEANVKVSDRELFADGLGETGSEADTYQKFYQEHYAYFNQTEQVHSHDELGLVFSLLNPNPILRPRLTEVYDHPWIQSASVVATQEIIQEMQELIKLPTPPERK